MIADLAVVVPTLNEADNVRPLLERMRSALSGIRWEAIFVDDDSTDGTAEILRDMARTEANVRVLHRIGRTGLASACIEGILATECPYVAVIDADLQHDEALLPEMFRIARDEDCEIVIGSRFAPGASASGLSSPSRERLSHWARRLSAVITRLKLTDPMSGFFLMRRELFDEVAHRLTGRGYKILLDILATVRRPVRIKEVPFEFRPRASGVSKLDTLVALEFLILIVDKLLGGWIPIGFVVYVFVGLAGLAIHLTLLGILFRIIGFSFLASQIVATITAMTVNFFLNNRITFRDRSLTGLAVFRGLLMFYAACSIGAVINVTVAQYLFDRGLFWFLAGFSGAIVGAVWNYGMNATFTWRRQRR